MLFIVRIIRNTQVLVHYVGKMQSFFNVKAGGTYSYHMR
jgi:hypothetical protein